MDRTTNSRNNEKQLALPALRTPLMGLAVQITEGIIMRRAMTVAQAQALYVPCTHTVEEIGLKAYALQLKSRLETTRQILDKLYRHGYIRRTQLPTDTFGRNPWLYGAATWKAIVETAGYYDRLGQEQMPVVGNDVAWRKQPQALAGRYGWSKTDKILSTSSGTLQHFVREIDVNVILTLACQNDGYEMVAWDSDIQVRRRHQNVQVRYVSPIADEQVTTAIIPDGWYVIRDPQRGSTVRFFVEIDLGTQTQQSLQTTNTEKRKKSWSHKFLAFKRFFEDGHFQDLYGEHHPGNVVIVTTSQLRMQRLQTLCSASGGKETFLFTFFDIFTPKNVFTQPIFQRAGGTTWVNLFAVAHRSP